MGVSETEALGGAGIMQANDLAFMRHALALAREAENQGEVPVGAVLVRDEVVIGEGFNRPIGSHDPSAHAEIIALRAAAAKVGNYRLTGATLYVTLEPCAMCSGALMQARVARVVYGANDPRAGAGGSVFDVLNSDKLNHRIDIQRGLLGEEAAQLLQNFFRARR